MQKTPIALRCLLQTNIRAARFHDRDYLVVPVVALKEGIIWPVNAPSPEFVPLAVLMQAPGGWNGRPVVIDHPTDGKYLVSANAPHILESNAFGQLFNTRIDGDRLLTEAWIDTSKARLLSDHHRWALDQIQNRKPIEVSIGALVATEQVTGLHGGTTYGTRWTNLTPDHLAFLPPGKTGACSIAMGCGALRAASSAELQSIVEGTPLADEPPSKIDVALETFRMPAGTPEGGRFAPGADMSRWRQALDSAKAAQASKLDIVMSALATIVKGEV